MKKTALISVMLLGSLSAAAQISISGFSLDSTGDSSLSFSQSVYDPDGEPCSVLRIESVISGWTFDTGLSGIMDSRYGEGTIYLYIPASARSITVSHPEYGVLRDWEFPVSLEKGRTYSMKLSYSRSARSSASSSGKGTRQVTPRKVTPHLPSSSKRLVIEKREHSGVTPAVDRISCNANKNFSHHFADLYVGASFSKDECSGEYSFEDNWFGLSYTWVGNRIGPYISFGADFNEGYSIFGGASFRLTDSSAAMDWQLYGGAGVIDETFGLDFGTRFAWRTAGKLSHWDFGFGCQMYGGTIIPTVSVGLYIWGIPALVGVGLVACAI